MAVRRRGRMVTAHKLHSVDQVPGSDACGVEDAQQAPELMRHLALALSSHVRRLNQDRLAVPREVEELTSLLMHVARARQYPPPTADGRGVGHYSPVPERLLITKDEVAQRLSVSVRTIERLVATGRLPQVYVERSARFRVKDLEAYVDNLAESHKGAVDLGSRNGGT